MRFPYRRSVGQDLRDLFGLGRADAQVRDLGMSSLRQGEGAIRLLGSNGTGVHAILGDLPDGRYGLGILVDGQIRTVPEIVDGVTGPLITRIADLELGQSRLTGQVESLRSTATAHASRLGELESNRVWQDGQISNINTTLGGYGTRLGSLESNRTWQDNQIDNLNESVGTLSGRVGTVVSNVTALTGRVGELESNRTWQDNQITNLNTNTGALASTVGSLVSGAAGIATRMGAAEGRLNGHDTGLAQQAQRQAQMQDEINEIRRRINQGGIPP